MGSESTPPSQNPLQQLPHSGAPKARSSLVSPKCRSPGKSLGTTGFYPLMQLWWDKDVVPHVGKQILGDKEIAQQTGCSERTRARSRRPRMRLPQCPPCTQHTASKVAHTDWCRPSIFSCLRPLPDSSLGAPLDQAAPENKATSSKWRREGPRPQQSVGRASAGWPL